MTGAQAAALLAPVMLMLSWMYSLLAETWTETPPVPQFDTTSQTQETPRG